MSAEPEEARTLDASASSATARSRTACTLAWSSRSTPASARSPTPPRSIAKSKRSNASVLIDALHFSRSGGLPAHVAQVDPALLRYAQLCDAGPGHARPHRRARAHSRGVDGRLLPGEGVFPLTDLVAALPAGRAAGHRGAVSSHRRPSRPRSRARAYQALSALVGDD